jgi:hypothetical protein
MAVQANKTAPAPLFIVLPDARAETKVAFFFHNSDQPGNIAL